MGQVSPQASVPVMSPLYLLTNNLGGAQTLDFSVYGLLHRTVHMEVIRHDPCVSLCITGLQEVQNSCVQLPAQRQFSFHSLVEGIQTAICKQLLRLCLRAVQAGHDSFLHWIPFDGFTGSQTLLHGTMKVHVGINERLANDVTDTGSIPVTRKDRQELHT